MDYESITARYYSKWIGEEDILVKENRGLLFKYSTERDITQYGYSKPFDIYAFCTGNSTIVSYGSKVDQKQLAEIQRQYAYGSTIADIKKALATTFECSVSHTIKFCYSNTDIQSKRARPLTLNEYGLYHDFFVANNPTVTDTDWLKEYFEDMVKENLCCGILDRGVLVSCSDMPGMPYMQSLVQEIGINTLPSHRRKGYASDVCALMAHNSIQIGKCPQWSTTADNNASIRLAHKVGFVKYADLFTVSI